MRRLIRIVVVAALAGAALLAVPAAALAASGSVSAGVCVKASAYPPESGPTLMVSTTTPYQGQTISTSGTGFCPDETVTLTIGATVMATTHTDGGGTFDPPIHITQDPGRYRLVATGKLGDRASVGLQVRSGSAVAPVSVHRPAANGHALAGAGSGTGGLAFTGTDVAMLVALAAILLGGGGYLAYAGRRRRLLRR
jgi:hypothetical protein